LAQTHDVSVPLLQSIALSNEHQIKHAIDLIRHKGKKKIGILGFAFKAGTDDLRESPVVTLAEALLGKGFDIKLYDSHVSLAKLIGTNRRYIEEHIPHISRLMVNSVEEIFAHAEIILIGNQDEKFYAALPKMRADQIAIDLTANPKWPETPGDYEKIAG
jgi:GDP-mannose 6-dehydrogenase